MGQRAPAERAHQAGIPFESSRSQHDIGRLNLNCTLRGLEADTGEGTLAHNQLSGAKSRSQLNLPVQAAAQEAPDQRKPHSTLVMCLAVRLDLRRRWRRYRLAERCLPDGDRKV